MSEPIPADQYNTTSHQSLQQQAGGCIMQPVAVVEVQQLDALERQLIAVLKQVWIVQGKHKKIVDLRQ